MKLFALADSRNFGEKIAAHLGISLADHEERDFEDGEHKIRPLESVRKKDVYVIHSLFGDDAQSPNDKLCRLLFFIGALKDAGAARVTAIIPYLCYARKDRKTKSRDPVTTRYIAQLFESVGVYRVVTIDVHNLQAYQNALRCRTEHLEARHIFARYFAEILKGKEITIVSPDIGGVKRAKAFQETLQKETGQDIPVAFMEKKRSAGVISGKEFVYGDVEGRSVVILDDMIASGSTMARTATAAKVQGAKVVCAAASHGLFVGKANEVFADTAIDQVVITDTVPAFRLTEYGARAKLKVLETTPLFAQCIQRLHEGGSIVELID